MQSTVLCYVIGFILLPTTVFANDVFVDQEDPGKFYAGFSVLKSDASCSHEGVDCEGAGWKGAVGYQFNKHIALEGGYYDLFSNEGKAADGSKVVTSATGLAVSTISSYPINPKTTLSGRVGILAWEAEGDTAGKTTAMMSGTNALLGVGASYKLNEHWQLKGEYENVGGDLETSIYSAGATLSTL